MRGKKAKNLRRIAKSFAKEQDSSYVYRKYEKTVLVDGKWESCRVYTRKLSEDCARYLYQKMKARVA